MEPFVIQRSTLPFRGEEPNFQEQLQNFFFGGKCSLHLHRLPGTIEFEPNCRMRSIFMDSINRKRRKTNPRKNTQQMFPFWIICFELTIIVNSKMSIEKGMMEHNNLEIFATSLLKRSRMLWYVQPKPNSHANTLSKFALKYKTKYVLKYQLHYLQVIPCHEKCGMVHGSVYSKCDRICPSFSLLYEVRHYRFTYVWIYLFIYNFGQSIYVVVGISNSFLSILTANFPVRIEKRSLLEFF